MHVFVWQDLVLCCFHLSHNNPFLAVMALIEPFTWSIQGGGGNDDIIITNFKIDFNPCVFKYA